MSEGGRGGREGGKREIFHVRLSQSICLIRLDIYDVEIEIVLANFLSQHGAVFSDCYFHLYVATGFPTIVSIQKIMAPAMLCSRNNTSLGCHHEFYHG